MDNQDAFLPFGIRNAIVQHMQSDPGREVCGFIEMLGPGRYAYVRGENIHSMPQQHFEMDRDSFTRVTSDDAVVAFVHSHPIGPTYPSQHDMEVQVAVAKPSVIVARDMTSGALEIFSMGDHVLKYPLLKREFRHGVTDCYEALRAWFYQTQNYYTPAFPRNDGWWGFMKNGVIHPAQHNYYETEFEKCGFEIVDVDPASRDPALHPQVGDVLLMKLGHTSVSNHAGVYIGGNRVFHHRHGHLSNEVPIALVIQSKFISKWLRRKK